MNFILKIKRLSDLLCQQPEAAEQAACFLELVQEK